MSGAPDIRPLQEPQRRASDPAASAWVSANAGSGKTFVLAARVLRLLLAGTPPDRLLCLTFTKAAAAEMKTRVFAELRRWAIADDATLDAAIAALIDRPPEPDERRRARQLFAAALETPGGLKIQTINAFGESILSRFPFEANIPAAFSVIDEAEAAELLTEARDAVFRQAAADPDGPLGTALDTVAARASEDTLRDLVKAVLARRGDFADWLGAAGGLEPALAGLAAALGLAPGDDRASVEADILASPYLPPPSWLGVANALPGAKKTDEKFADGLRRAEAATTVAARAETFMSLFLTREGRPAARSVVTKDVAATDPAVFDLIAAEQERMAGLAMRHHATVLLEGSAALFRLCEAMLGRYEADKRAAGLIDYADQIERTRALLTRNRGAAWVLYKLDHGVDHILVDEAQDTNPAQWEIVQALAEEFFAGAGARTAGRTLFAVGDEKQSIYSFQGADPARFDLMRRHFSRRAADAGERFERVELTSSFRTVQPVLDAVDTLFDDPQVRAGVVSGETWPAHTSTRRDRPGRVELWPAVEPSGVEVEDAWRLPVDAPAAVDAVKANAARIASVIQIWLQRRERLAPGSEAMMPGDILVLVRKRGAIADALIRELRQRGVPVAGADRVTLADHIAVEDLLALARFVLQPEDDLTLAALLKSPLCGLDDDDLIRLAPGRAGTLFEAVAADPACVALTDRLRGWLARADVASPFGFFSETLGPDGGRRAFHARMGPEVDDVLDEFLALAMTYQSHTTPSLQGLVRFVEEAGAEIKRDMDQSRGEVRVMTVHGAKGLEAPVVIVADTLTKPSAAHTPRILALGGETGPLVWRVAASLDVDPVRAAVDDARRAAEEESRRLLYVAMTRARDRLYLAGHNTDRRKPADEQEGHWYSLLGRVLGATCEEVEDPYGLGFPVRRFADFGDPGTGATPAEAGIGAAALPDWAIAEAPAEPVPPRVLAPSGAWEAASGTADRTVPEPPPPDPLAAVPVRRAAERGRLIHRLLQSLPDLAPDMRRAAADRFLAAHALEWSGAEHAAMRDEVLAILAAPDIASLFGVGSRAEVPVVGTVAIGGQRHEVAGIVDRIAATPEKVIVADYKSNVAPPAMIDGIPPAYLTQMAVYATLIGRLFPAKPVETVLVWTAGPSVTVLPPDRLAACGVAP